MPLPVLLLICGTVLLPLLPPPPLRTTLSLDLDCSCCWHAVPRCCPCCRRFAPPCRWGAVCSCCWHVVSRRCSCCSRRHSASSSCRLSPAACMQCAPCCCLCCRRRRSASPLLLGCWSRLLPACYVVMLLPACCSLCHAAAHAPTAARVGASSLRSSFTDCLWWQQQQKKRAKAAQHMQLHANVPFSMGAGQSGDGAGSPWSWASITYRTRQ